MLYGNESWGKYQDLDIKFTTTGMKDVIQGEPRVKTEEWGIPP